jgi:small subunit ribosomal protein S10
MFKKEIYIMSYHLKIVMQSFEPNSLTKSEESISKVKLGIEKITKKVLSISTSSLPIKIKKWTVLRSPHIDKKSREQFEMREFQKVFTIKFSSAKEMNIFLKSLIHSEFYSTGLRLALKNQSYLIF